MDKEQILKQYLESTFYEKYKETYVSDKILREFFEEELKLHRLYGIKEYKQAHQFNVNVMTDLLNLFSRTTKVDDEKVVYNMVNAFYLDPDGFEIRKIGGIDCSADGLLSIKRIYRKYGMSEETIYEYEKYRRIPIFFFLQEMNGINMSRASVFGDKIDYTLFDLKRKFAGNICRLDEAYNLPKTNAWLKNIGSFEKLVEIYKIKGIFVNENYEVFDLEKGNGSLITDYCDEYSWTWSERYYNQLKSKIDLYMKKNNG